jgi:hypothetical protein
MTASTPRAGVTVSDEGVELAAVVICSGCRPAAKNAPCNEHRYQARAAITAVLPRLVEEIREEIGAAIEAERERILSISKLSGLQKARVSLAMGSCRDIARTYGRDQ